METLHTEDGQLFIRSLANFIRQHEKALANSLQFSVSRKQPSHNPSASTTSLASLSSTTTVTSASHSSSSIASAFSFAGLNFMSHSIKPAHLTLTPHHLFYLLSRIEELGIAIGPMNVRLENISHDPSPANYVSFLQSHRAPAKGRSDNDSIHSVSSVRSVMSGMSAFWSSIGLGPSASKTEKAKAAMDADIKYLYSAFTKLPSLRLTPDHRARLIKGYEEFPFDTAVPLFAFKNVQHLEIIDMDFRQFCGWDRLADQLCLLTVKRAKVDDPADLLTNIVLDDAEKRRRRSNKGTQGSPTSSWTVPSTPRVEYPRSNSDPGSPADGSPKKFDEQEDTINKYRSERALTGSVSPKQPTPPRPTSSYRHVRSYSSKIKRSGSGSSNSSDYSVIPNRNESVSNLLTTNILAPSKWQRLKYLSLADNALTYISASSIAPLAPSLRSFNLASNLFAEIPDSLSSLTRLTSLDLSNCMIDSLQSLSRNPLPAITTLKLKSNRLRSLAGIERLLSLENLNIQDNHLADPVEAARLTGIPNLRRIWVKHNPFTKRHADYRLTIFNLFRKTPGYLEDLVIDDYGPNYVERKQLVDRVPEIERPPLVRTVQITEPPVIVQRTESIRKNSETEPTDEAVERSRDVQTEIAANSSRRRKGTRRRIVDLSKDEFAPSTSGAEVEASSIRVPKVHSIPALPKPPKSPVKDAELQVQAMQSSEFKVPVSSGEPPLIAGGHLHDDDYRLRVEALRREFGPNWISILSEQTWHGNRDAASEDLVNHPPRVHRTTSHAIVSSGRTLG